MQALEVVECIGNACQDGVTLTRREDVGFFRRESPVLETIPADPLGFLFLTQAKNMDDLCPEKLW